MRKKYFGAPYIIGTGSASSGRVNNLLRQLEEVAKATKRADIKAGVSPKVLGRPVKRTPKKFREALDDMERGNKAK